MSLWRRCADHFKGGPVPSDVPSKELEELRAIYTSGDLWRGEGPQGTSGERMVAFSTTERVERILDRVLTGNCSTPVVEKT